MDRQALLETSNAQEIVKALMKIRGSTACHLAFGGAGLKEIRQ